MSNEIANVKSFFTSIQVHFSELWLESCINWCKTENLSHNYTLKELQSQVYEQWLLLDLRDLEVPILPPNISSKTLYTLNGNFCLQMMKIIDISKPKLWQLQKIRNSNVLTRDTQKDADIVGTGKRLLQMTLTDGKQEIEAMEYKFIASLSLNLPPGSKIRILGPVVVRRGKLMLEQQNVKVLGGEVEELLICNAAENILAKSLNLPQNPKPGMIEEKKLAVEQDESNLGFVSNVKRKPPLQLTEEEQMLMAEEFEHVMDTEPQPKQDLFENDFEEDFDYNIKTSTQKPNTLSVSLENCDDDDIFNNIDIDTHLDEIDNQRDNLPQTNITTISNLLEKQNFVSKGVFKIKAKFKSVEEKLTVSDGEYKLVIKIEDSSGEIIARLHSDVVAELAECSAAEIITLKNSVMSKNEAAVEKMMGAIMKVKEKLLKLNNTLSIQIEKDQLPVIKKAFINFFFYIQYWF